MRCFLYLLEQAILVSGLILGVAVAALSFVTTDLVKTIGISGSVGVGVALVCNLTLVPSLLLIFGECFQHCIRRPVCRCWCRREPFVHAIAWFATPAMPTPALSKSRLINLPSVRLLFQIRCKIKAEPQRQSTRSFGRLLVSCRSNGLSAILAAGARGSCALIGCVRSRAVAPQVVLEMLSYFLQLLWFHRLVV